MCRGVYIHYFKINPPIFCCPLFSQNHLNPPVRINKMVNKHTVDYQPSPSQLISRTHLLVLLWTPEGFISPESFLSFFLSLYIPPWLRKSFKFIVLRLLQIHFWVKKATTRPPPLACFHHYSQADGNCPFLPNSVFWRYFFLSRKERERIIELKKLPKLTKLLVTSFDKFHHLCKL